MFQISSIQTRLATFNFSEFTRTKFDYNINSTPKERNSVLWQPMILVFLNFGVEFITKNVKD